MLHNFINTMNHYSLAYLSPCRYAILSAVHCGFHFKIFVWPFWSLFQSILCFLANELFGNHYQNKIDAGSMHSRCNNMAIKPKSKFTVSAGNNKLYSFSTHYHFSLSLYTEVDSTFIKLPETLVRKSQTFLRCSNQETRCATAMRIQ